VVARAQQPGTYTDADNNYYQQAELPVYLFVSTKPQVQGATQLPHSDSNQPRLTSLEPIILDGHGIHYLKHIDDDQKISQVFTIHADGRAPVTKAVLNDAPSYFADNIRYYGKGLQLELNPTDELSGLKETFIGINNDPEVYRQVEAFTTEGPTAVSYFSVDNVGNDESPKELRFTVDLSAPETVQHITGISEDSIVSPSTRIYFTSSDALSGVSTTRYSIDDEDFRTYNGRNIPIAALSDGNHTIRFYSIDRVDNQEQEQQFSFYLDKSAPILASDILGDRFIANNQVYFSGRTKLKLTAVDNKSGVKQTMYSIDGSEFAEYDQPFYLPSESGIHTIRFYALDNSGNRSRDETSGGNFQQYKHNVSTVYVDLTGPDMNWRITGPKVKINGKEYISSRNRIRFSGSDAESGLQYFSYRLNGQGGEARYNQPFSLAEEGKVTIDMYGYDNVNNRNVQTFDVVVDNTPPEVQVIFGVQPTGETAEGTAIYPDVLKIYLAAIDQFVGTDQISYSINGGRSTVYAKPLEGFKAGSTYTLSVSAEDKLGNVQEQTFTFSVSE
jgi:hypothetical protein